jgi:virulence factor Mce-like protein
VNVPRLIARVALLAAVGTVVLIVVSRGAGYIVHLRMNDALGLRDGSKVVEGGVQVGTVQLRLARHDQVIATLDIDRRYAPVGRDARAQVTSLNLLGQKSLQLLPGNRRRPAPSGFTLAASRVTPATDLDQVLDVLAPETRSRLTILIDEAGAAFAGRRADISTLLNELPSSLSAGSNLLGQLDHDNQALARLVSNSDAFITSIDGQRPQLGRLVNTLGQTAVSVEPRDAQLQATLRRLPGTLATAQRFLTDLRTSTVPLGPAARDIQSVAPGLTDTLRQLAPFTTSATPALRAASAAAPQLTALAVGATPVLQEALPTLSALTAAVTDAQPVTHALSLSIDNILATAWNWSHAVELRDSLSHLFRAEFSITPQTATRIVNQLISTGGLPAARGKTSSSARSASASASAAGASGANLSSLSQYLLKP